MASKGSWAVVKISLLVADVVLVALLVLWQSSTTNRMGALEALTCVIAAGLGAWLAGLAAWLHFNQAALRKNQGG